MKKHEAVTPRKKKAMKRRNKGGGGEQIRRTGMLRETEKGKKKLKRPRS